MEKRSFFHLRDSEKRGYIIFLLLICLILLAIFLLDNYRSRHISSTDLSSIDTAKLHAFQEQLRLDSGRYHHSADEWDYVAEAETFPFNPNTCDSATFVRLGLKSWQAHNALKYRRRGGVWKTADDFRRLYGLSEADFMRLRPYIQIDSPADRVDNQPEPDTITLHYPQKYPKGMRIEINTADTTALRGIPGVGSYYARKIFQYRENLGGFLSMEQLKDIEGLPDNISEYLYLASGYPVRRISINKANFKTLVRHPYLSYEQTCDIVNYIHKYGKLKSWRDLQFSSHFTENDFQRLAPYFDFN
ncbi:MAG: helix-hairpin-helix domain-containing protein [Alloprevotella sp.]|nr:helix-hairpin-helix domain-containing protein [Alloprevotella sp.]